MLVHRGVVGHIVRSCVGGIIPSSSGSGDSTLTHIILYGQSLSLGTDPVSASVISSEDANHRMFNGGVRAHYDLAGIPNVNSPVRPEQIASLSNLAEQVNPNDSTLAETFASGMAQWMTARGLFSATGRGAYGIVSTPGLARTHSDSWLHFVNTHATVIAARELADAAGLTYSLGAIVLKQGEADADRIETKADFKSAVQTLLADLKTHLKVASLTDTSALKMVVDQQAYQNSLDGYGEIAVAMIELHRSDVGIVCAGPTYVESFSANNNLHMSSNGYRNYGEKLGRVVETINQGGTWNPCYITTVSRSTTTITVNVHVPSPPLTTDTTLVTAVANSGFAYSGANITDVSIADTGAGDNAGVITITIDADAGGTLEYAYENGTNANVGPVSGPRGNIRDSESAVTNNDGKNLYNWLCVDQWVVA